MNKRTRQNLLFFSLVLVKVLTDLNYRKKIHHQMVSELSIGRWVSIKMHHHICLVSQKMQEKLYIFTSENFFPLLCSLCFSKALSLQKRLNLTLFTSKPKLSLPNPFLFSSFNYHFLEIQFFVSKFFEIFSVLSFVFIFYFLFKKNHVKFSNVVPHFYSLQPQNSYHFYQNALQCLFLKTCFHFCDILICYCLLHLSFNVCLLRKEMGGKEVLNFMMWVLLVPKKSETIISLRAGVVISYLFPTINQRWWWY